MWYNLKMDGVPNRRGQNPWGGNYCAAAKFEAEIKPWRNRPTDPKPIGDRSKANVKRVERLESGDIVFSLWGEPAVTFHPDGDISVTGWPSVSRRQFIERLTPQEIGYVPVNNSLLLCKDGHWPSYWRGGDPKSNAHAARLDQGATVRLTHASGRWWPKDEASLTPFNWLEVDRSEARGVMREHPLGEFRAALNAYQALLPGKMRPYIYSHAPDPHAMLDLIEKRDFAAAIEIMPTMDTRVWDNGGYVGRAPRFSSTMLTKMRQLLYVRSGVARRQEASILPLSKWRPAIRHNPYTRWETGQ